MQIRDLIEALKRFDPCEEITIEVEMPLTRHDLDGFRKYSEGRAEHWTKVLRIEDIRRDRVTPVIVAY